jgi:hypothetical protein
MIKAQMAGKTRERALFDLAIDSKLRGWRSRRNADLTS